MLTYFLLQGDSFHTIFSITLLYATAWWQIFHFVCLYIHNKLLLQGDAFLGTAYTRSTEEKVKPSSVQ